jgi:phosphoglycerate dehydrogenase-like enzyme
VKVVLAYGGGGPVVEAHRASWREDGLDLVPAPEGHPSLLEELRDADVLLHVLEPVTAEVLAAAPRLRLVQKVGVGVNSIDLEAAAARGVLVANMPGTNHTAVAEAALMLMLAVLRRLVAWHEATRAGRGWPLDPRGLEHVGELRGRTVGLVGAGKVAAALVPALRALGAKVLYASRREAPELDAERRPLGELLPAVDVLSLHVPLVPETEGLIGAAELELLRPGAVLVNTARGPLVDEPALLGALRSGRLAGAGLDVFEHEPLPDGHPLLGLPNVVVMPHVAWLTQETLARSLEVARDNVGRLRDGRVLVFRVA